MKTFNVVADLGSETATHNFIAYCRYVTMTGKEGDQMYLTILDARLEHIKEMEAE